MGVAVFNCDLLSTFTNPARSQAGAAPLKPLQPFIPEVKNFRTHKSPFKIFLY